MAFVERSLQTSYGVINFAEGPTSGSPMVWLHGVSGRWQRWRGHMETFSSKWQQFALDARGHGKSSRVPGRYSWLDHASDLDAFVREKLNEPAVLIGHSLGGLESVKVAADQPENVRAIVLEDPPLYAAEHPDADYTLFRIMEGVAASGMTADQIVQGWTGEPWMTDELRKEYAEALTQLDPENLSASISLEATRGFDVDEHLGRIDCPTLLVRAGGSGAALSELDQERALACLSHGTAITIPDSGHMVHAEQSSTYQRAIEEFLAKL